MTPLDQEAFVAECYAPRTEWLDELAYCYPGEDTLTLTEIAERLEVTPQVLAPWAHSLAASGVAEVRTINKRTTIFFSQPIDELRTLAWSIYSKNKERYQKTKKVGGDRRRKYNHYKYTMPNGLTATFSLPRTDDVTEVWMGIYDYLNRTLKHA
jgi:predicted transcriptional regulator